MFETQIFEIVNQNSGHIRVFVRRRFGNTECSSRKLYQRYTYPYTRARVICREKYQAQLQIFRHCNQIAMSISESCAEHIARSRTKFASEHIRNCKKLHYLDPDGGRASFLPDAHGEGGGSAGEGRSSSNQKNSRPRLYSDRERKVKNLLQSASLGISVDVEG